MRYLKSFLVLLLLVYGASYLCFENHKRMEKYVWGLSIDSHTREWVYQYYPNMSEEEIHEVLKDRIVGKWNKKADEIASHLIQLCKKHGFDPALVLSVIHAESSFRTWIVSHANAIGLMQIQPATAKYVSRVKKIPYQQKEELKDPFKNLTLGVAYLAMLRDRYGKNIVHFLAAYNAGPTKIDRLLRQQKFKPRQTKTYIKKIRNQVNHMRYYYVMKRAAEDSPEEPELLLTGSISEGLGVIRRYLLEGNQYRGTGERKEAAVKKTSQKRDRKGVI